MVVFEQATQPLVADHLATVLPNFGARLDDLMIEVLMVSFGMKMATNSLVAVRNDRSLKKIIRSRPSSFSDLKYRSRRALQFGPLGGSSTDVISADTKFTAEFRAILDSSGVASVLLPPKSPNCNAHLERFFRSLKEEALERLIFFSERSLRTATNEFVAHFHAERNHQGLDHRIIEPGNEVGQGTGGVFCRERLGGLLKYYHRQAA